MRRSVVFTGVVFPVAALLLLAVPLLSWANPDGGVVRSGTAIIAGEGSPHVTVMQSTQRALIDWNNFGMTLGDQLDFIQPNNKSITVNRVLGDYNGIDGGTVTSTGRVLMILPNGRIQKEQRSIDGAGLSKEAGKLTGGNRRENKGQPTEKALSGVSGMSVRKAGLGSLVPGNANMPYVAAGVGHTDKGTGTGVTLDMYGDGLVFFELGTAAAGKLLTADGKNFQDIARDGDTVVLTAASARDVVNQTTNVRSIHHIHSISRKGGKIVIERQK
jgi:filamentous hemagglutinin family protein